MTEGVDVRVRILIAHPGAEMYGADRVVLESTRALTDGGHDVTVALPEHGPLTAALSDAGARVAVVPMFVLRKQLLSPRKWPELIASTLRGAVATWRLIGRVRPDIGYVSTVILPQWTTLLRLRRTPALAHVHEAESASPWWMRAVLYTPLLAASSVIANSRFTAQVVRDTFPVLQKRTTVILNPVVGPSTLQPLRERPDRIRIAFIGRLSPRKGPDVVVEAIPLLRARGHRPRLEIVGDVFRGYEWFGAELDDRIRALHLTDAVRRRGYASDVLPHLIAADVIAVTSRVDESFGNVAVEAVLAGRPVIVSDLTGLREAVAEYPTARVVPVGDSTSVAEAIDGLIDEWDDMRSKVSAAARRATEKHSRQAYGDALRTTLAQISLHKSERLSARPDRMG
ncbi:glycosyltransferase [Microbacterium sp. OR16]|uniref:glycosyltransferase n=1 Tax=Microbacterium sp. OR16 TaxID=3095345 RepID=UPI0039B67671